MRKVLLSSMMVLLLALLAVGCATEGETNDESDGEANNQESEEETTGEQKDQTITLGVTPWTSTVPPTEIAKLILEDMGYTVEETEANVSSIFVGLSTGDIDAFMDSWLPLHEQQLEEYSDSVENTATSYNDAAAGMVVPTYMEDIESISDLKGREGEFNNEFYGIEEGASVTQVFDNIIEGYGLDMEQVNSSEGGMLAQAQRYMSQEEPVAFYGWRPHTMFNTYDLKVLEDEKGYFEQASVHVLTNKDFKDNAFEAYEFLSNWSIDINDVEEMIVKIENEGVNPEEVAQNWIDNNQDKVDEMLPE